MVNAYKGKTPPHNNGRQGALVLGRVSALCAMMLAGCAHTPPPPGEPCPSWEAGWIEYRAETCSYWRCEAATLRWTQVAQEQCALPR